MAKSRNVTADNFVKAVEEALSKYSEYVSNTVVDKAIESTAKRVSEIVSSGAPVRTGKYKSSITYGEKKKAKSKTVMTVYAEAPHYRLTHLLEHGHRTKAGYTVGQRSHWATAEDQAGEILIDEIKKSL